MSNTSLAAAANIRKEITTLAATSAIAHFEWTDDNENQDPAPQAYIKGMALSYARVYCKFKSGHPAALEMARAKSGHAGADTDAFAYLAGMYAQQGLNNDVAGIDCLRNLFVLLFGLGVDESSGRYCKGRYLKDGFNQQDNAEAGMFQSAFNLTHPPAGHPNPSYGAVLLNLFNHYEANPTTGFAEVFRTGITCNANDAINWGQENTPGWRYQQLAKTCPAFAVEFTGVALRNRPRHWAPIRDRYVEIVPVCRELLIGIEGLVDRPPGFCAQVL